MEVLEQVGIPDASDRIRDFPHQFSGGMQQRIMIAMALTSTPSLLVADEATSALDVTLEAQILNLLKEMRRTYQTAILFISHDLGVIAQLCDRVIIMYAGNVIEQGPVHDIFANPQHPYTQSLLASVPSRKRYTDRLATIPGLVPSLAMLPGAIVGSIVDEGLGQLIASPFQWVGTTFLASYSRDQERHADRLGQKLAAKAGFDPAAMISAASNAPSSRYVLPKVRWTDAFDSG